MTMPMKRLKVLSLLLVLVVTTGFVWDLPPLIYGHRPTAIALIQQEQEKPDQTLFKTRHRLQDSQGRTWQTIVYKRVKGGQSLGVNLRLVGFLGAVEIDHPAKLEVITHSGDLLLATDQFAEGSPSANVGEYDFTQVLGALTDYQALTINLPLVGDRDTTLTIPSPVSLEWQQLNTQN